MPNIPLYKYRSLKDIRRFIDIVLYSRLHASNYKDLNDPMEGVFCYSKDIPNTYIENLRSEKMQTLICSLSKDMHNGLMWSFYADEHRGCCIELKVTSKLWKEVEVDYSADVFALDHSELCGVEDVLGRKSVQWQHEQEVRYIRTFGAGRRINPFVSVSISKIWLGMNINRNDEYFIKKLVESINSGISVEKIKRENIDFGYTT